MLWTEGKTVPVQMLLTQKKIRVNEPRHPTGYAFDTRRDWKQ
jgi:hypothetical protein